MGCRRATAETTSKGLTVGFSRAGMRMRRAAVMSGVVMCVMVLAAFAAASARADSFTWNGPVSLQSTGGSNALPAVSCAVTNPGARRSRTTAPPPTVAGSRSPSRRPRAPSPRRTPVDINGTPTAISCPASTQCTIVDTNGDEATFNPVQRLDDQSGGRRHRQRRLSDRSRPPVRRRLVRADPRSASPSTTRTPPSAFDPNPLSNSPVKLSTQAVGSSPHGLVAISCAPGSQTCSVVDNHGSAYNFTVTSSGGSLRPCPAAARSTARWRSPRCRAPRGSSARPSTAPGTRFRSTRRAARTATRSTAR